MQTFPKLDQLWARALAKCPQIVQSDVPKLPTYNSEQYASMHTGPNRHERRMMPNWKREQADRSVLMRVQNQLLKAQRHAA